VDKSIGLKKDGTVISTDSGWLGKDLAKWTDIIAISVKGGRCLGLKKDGTVVMAGYNENNQCDVSTWTDIIANSVGDNHSVGLKKDGTMVATGDWKRFDTLYQWKLFDGGEDVYKALQLIQKAREQRATLRQKQAFRKKRLCQHCGGKFKGLFRKTCTSCGKRKDYR
jgi:alpha-tubulin suppressor-like RCC1 family protein